MKQTGILMRPELVLATREERKDMTRRVMKEKMIELAKRAHALSLEQVMGVVNPPEDMKIIGFDGTKWRPADVAKLCPYGGPGDQLYIKEPFLVCGIEREHEESTGATMHFVRVRYKDGHEQRCLLSLAEYTKWWAWKKSMDDWKSPFFMFKSLARTWLDITDVFGQRIRDISEEDCVREGCVSDAVLTPDGQDYTGLYAYDRYADLWDSINKAKGNGWEENKWQWAITYKLIK